MILWKTKVTIAEFEKIPSFHLKITSHSSPSLKTNFHYLQMMIRLLGIFLALVLAGAAIPASFSYQEDQKPEIPDHGKLSFNGYSNRTQISFGGYSNQTFPFSGFNQTNRGQEISYLVHEINYLRQELANIIKEQKKDGNQTKSHQLKLLGIDVSANNTSVSNPGHDIKTGKTYQNTRGHHSGH